MRILGETNFDFISQVNVEKLQKISWQYDQSFFLIFLDDRSIRPPHVHIRNIFEDEFFFSELCYTKMMILKNLLMTVRSTFQNLVGDFLKSTLHLYCPPSFSFTPNNDRDAVGWDLQISLLGKGSFIIINFRL